MSGPNRTGRIGFRAGGKAEMVRTVPYMAHATG
jgi:hypothetical protein